MVYALSIVGILGSIAMLKYRQQVGDMMGEAEWMSAFGGVYNFVVILAIFILFWSITSLTGTQDVLFRPFLYLFPGGARMGVGQ